MDPISQAALGACAAVAVAGHRLPRVSVAIGLMAGAAPDLDVLIRSDTDPLVWFIYHRHFTHALLFVPFGAAVCAALFAAAPSLRAEWRAVFLASIAAFATHGFLDAATSYGTLLLWPFSNARIEWDILPIVDIVLTPVMLAGLVVAFWKKARWPVVVALAFFILYCGFGIVQRERAQGWQGQLAEARGDVIEHARTMPAPGSLMVWRSIYRTPDGELQADGLRLVPFRSAQAIPGERTRAATPENLPDTPEAERIWRDFNWFADGYIVSPGGDRLILADGRYSAEGTGWVPMWGVRMAADGESATSWSPPQGRDGFAGRLWRLLIGSDERLRPARDVVEGL